MTQKGLNIAEDRELTSPFANEPEFYACDEAFLEVCELVNRGDDEAANQAFYDSYERICDLLGQVDFVSAGELLDEDLSELSELRARLRKVLVRGLSGVFVCAFIILVSFVTLPW